MESGSFEVQHVCSDEQATRYRFRMEMVDAEASVAMVLSLRSSRFHFLTNSRFYTLTTDRNKEFDR